MLRCFFYARPTTLFSLFCPYDKVSEPPCSTDKISNIDESFTTTSQSAKDIEICTVENPKGCKALATHILDTSNIDLVSARERE